MDDQEEWALRQEQRRQEEAEEERIAFEMAQEQEQARTAPSLERRAEELLPVFRDPRNDGFLNQTAADLIEQLLSENRQVREHHHARMRQLTPDYDALRQDLDRISTEREAYRTFMEEVAAQKNTNTTAIGTGGTQTLGTHTHLAEQARRILAENDR